MEKKLYIIALICLIINIFYCLAMYSMNGNYVPLLISNKKIDDSLFLRRRLYAIELWICFIGAFIVIFLFSELTPPAFLVSFDMPLVLNNFLTRASDVF